MHFEDLKQLHVAFMGGNFELSTTIKVHSVDFKLFNEELPSLVVMSHNPAKKAAIVYSAGSHHRDDALKAGLDEWIVLVWKMSNLAVKPYGVRTMPRTAAIRVVEEEGTHIGQNCEVKLLNLPGSQPIQAVVDTGATLCSLHAENIKVDPNGKTVSFTCRHISPNHMKMALADLMPVKSPNTGVEDRPVIKVNLGINDQEVNDVLVNLNDREGMNTPFLLGMNALQAGGFVVDPSMESLNLTDIEMLKDVGDEILEAVQDEVDAIRGKNKTADQEEKVAG